MKYLGIYYIIGLCVSAYHIYYYRFSVNKQAPKPTDAIGGLFGAFVWPIQLIVHMYTKKRN